MAIFRFFQNGGRHHFGFLKLQISNCETHHECRIAPPCQISYFCETFAEISRFRIFQDGGCRHLGFLKILIFNDRCGQEGRVRHCAKVYRNCSNLGGDMSIFTFNGRNGQEGRTASLCEMPSKSLDDIFVQESTV